MRRFDRKLNRERYGMFWNMNMRILIGLLYVSAFALDAPTITVEQRARFWRAQAEYVVASVQAQKAKTLLDAIQAELQKSCGTDALIVDKSGEPACGPKPETAKP
jgi:hypothetical protein